MSNPSVSEWAAIVQVSDALACSMSVSRVCADSVSFEGFSSASAYFDSGCMEVASLLHDPGLP